MERFTRPQWAGDGPLRQLPDAAALLPPTLAPSMPDSDFADLIDRLDRVRRQFADLLLEVSSSPLSAGVGPAAEGWAEPLNVWWRNARAGAPPDAAELYSRLVEHGRVLFRLAEHLGENGEKTPGTHRELASLLDEFQRSLAASLGAPPLDASGMFSPITRLLESWRAMSAGLFGVPGNPSRGLSGFHGASDITSLKELLGGGMNPGSAAGAGMSAADAAQFVEALVDYQDKFNRFAHLAIQVTAQAMSNLKSALADESRDEPVGVRELYALWLDCSESAYDELARGDEFADALAGLVNGALRLRTVRQKLLDGAAASLGMPTRAEMRELTRALDQTRRELRRQSGTSAKPRARLPATKPHPAKNTKRKTVKKKSKKPAARHLADDATAIPKKTRAVRKKSAATRKREGVPS